MELQPGCRAIGHVFILAYPPTLPPGTTGQTLNNVTLPLTPEPKLPLSLDVSRTGAVIYAQIADLSSAGEFGGGHSHMPGKGGGLALPTGTSPHESGSPNLKEALQHDQQGRCVMNPVGERSSRLLVELGKLAVKVRDLGLTVSLLVDNTESSRTSCTATTTTAPGERVGAAGPMPLAAAPSRTSCTATTTTAPGEPLAGAPAMSDSVSISCGSNAVHQAPKWLVGIVEYEMPKPGPVMVVCVTLHLPPSIWTGGTGWKPSPSAVAVMNALVPLSVPRQLWLTELGRQETEAKQAKLNPYLYSLGSCLKELPSSCTLDPAPPPMLLGDALMMSDSAYHLSNLPKEVLMRTLSFLGPLDLANICSSCRYVYVQGCVQAAEYRWLTEDELPVYANLATGEISTYPPAETHDVCGGLFCDEPGLGKTVTALSLILKTRGTVPSPPPGCTVTWSYDLAGRRAGFYTASDSATAASRQQPIVSASGDAGKPLGRHAQGQGNRRSGRRSNVDQPQVCSPLPEPRNSVEAGKQLLGSCHHAGSCVQGGSRGDADDPLAPEPCTLAGVASHPLAPEPCTLGGVASHPLAPEPCTLGGVASHPLAAEPCTLGGVASHPLASEPCTLAGLASHPLASEPCTLGGGAAHPLALEPSAALTEKRTGSTKLDEVKHMITTTMGVNSKLGHTLVQCDDCQKWRKIDPEQVNGEEHWFCHMHPDPDWRQCSVPEEPEEVSSDPYTIIHVVQSLGYIHRPDWAIKQELGFGGTRELAGGGSRELGYGGTKELGYGGTQQAGNGGTRELGYGSTKELGYGGMQQAGNGQEHEPLKHRGKGEEKEQWLGTSKAGAKRAVERSPARWNLSNSDSDDDEDYEYGKEQGLAKARQRPARRRLQGPRARSQSGRDGDEDEDEEITERVQAPVRQTPAGGRLRGPQARPQYGCDDEEEEEEKEEEEITERVQAPVRQTPARGRLRGPQARPQSGRDADADDEEAIPIPLNAGQSPILNTRMKRKRLSSQKYLESKLLDDPSPSPTAGRGRKPAAAATAPPAGGGDSHTYVAQGSRGRKRATAATAHPAGGGESLTLVVQDNEEAPLARGARGRGRKPATAAAPTSDTQNTVGLKKKRDTVGRGRKPATAASVPASPVRDIGDSDYLPLAQLAGSSGRTPKSDTSFFSKRQKFGGGEPSAAAAAAGDRCGADGLDGGGGGAGLVAGGLIGNGSGAGGLTGTEPGAGGLLEAATPNTLSTTPQLGSPETPGGDPENVDHFLSVIRSHPAALPPHCRGALYWLAYVVDVTALHQDTGLTIPTEFRNPELGYPAAFSSLGLINGMHPSFYPEEIKRGEVERHTEERWGRMGVAPAPVNSGKEAKPGERHGLRVYLSPATLVVVPVQLFPPKFLGCNKSRNAKVKHRSLRVR
eukprot:gene31045-7138_t